jgi:hypothetical protein
VYSASGPLTAGAALQFDTDVLTGADGFAIVRIEWSTPVGQCTSDNAFGFGQPFRVTRPSGACIETVTTGAVSTLQRLDVGKPDGGSSGSRLDPAQVAEFEALRQGMRPLVQRQNRAAHDFGNLRVSSAGECSLACARDSRCMAMTYLTDDHGCWLKDEMGSPQDASQAISAIKRVKVRARILATPPRK